MKRGPKGPYKPYSCKCGETNPKKFMDRYKTVCMKCLHLRYKHKDVERRRRNKTCTKCGIKGFEHFEKVTSHYCKSCKAISLKRIGRKRNRKPLPLSTILRASRLRAEKKQMDHEIDLKFLKELLIKQENTCPYTGYEFDPKSIRYKSMSIDRIDSNKGYTKDNVQIISTIANYMKNRLSEDEFLQVIKDIYNYRNLQN